MVFDVKPKDWDCTVAGVVRYLNSCPNSEIKLPDSTARERLLRFRIPGSHMEIVLLSDDKEVLL